MCVPVYLTSADPSVHSDLQEYILSSSSPDTLNPSTSCLSVLVRLHAAAPSAPHQRRLDEEESEARGHEGHESWTTTSHHK